MVENPEMLNKLVDQAVNDIKVLRDYLTSVTTGFDNEFCEDQCNSAITKVRSVMEWWRLGDEVRSKKSY